MRRGCFIYIQIAGQSKPIRERQILAMIDKGMKSGEIAAQLHISIHTVSCHRQEIIGKLQVKNTHEACRIAKSMGLLE